MLGINVDENQSLKIEKMRNKYRSRYLILCRHELFIFFILLYVNNFS